MKKIGIVGGISRTSIMEYHRFINEEVNKQPGSLNFADCIIYSINFEYFRNFNAAHNWDQVYELLLNATLHLKNAGADCILLAANTAHIVAERIEEKITLPLIDIRKATGDAIKAKGIQTVGLPGTVYTMELDFYKSRLSKYGIRPITPRDQRDRQFIEETLVHEPGKGIICQATKERYIHIAGELLRQGAEGIVLGYTEIPLLLSQSDFSCPAFNTTYIHAQATVDFALSNK